MPQQLYPWFMWSLPLSFFAFQFILRLFPGLVMSEFLTKYQISATDFGIFASLYYVGYAGMQIPIATLLDKYGPRIVVGLSAIICGFAVESIIVLNSWNMALVSRFLIGVGSVAGFLGTSKVISLWFPKQRYARLVGLTFSFGLLGALYGGKPISLLLTQVGWEKVAFMLGLTAILLGLLSLIFVRNKLEIKEMTALPLITALKRIVKNKTLLLLAVGNFLMVGSLEGFADVWGVSYLMTAKDLSKVEASSIISFIFVGMLLGGPILAYFSEKFNAHYKVTIFCGIAMSALLGCVLYLNAGFSTILLSTIMFLIGILCCYQVIVFAIGTQLVSKELLGITVAFLNCINMLGGSFFHVLIGHLLDYFEQGSLLNGVKYYSVEAYTYTLYVIPLASLLGATLLFFNNSKKMFSYLPIDHPN